MFGFTEFFQQIFSPAMLPFTILMLIVAGYWLVVIFGMIDIEILDFGDFDVGSLVEDISESTGEVVEAATGSTESSLHALLGFINIGTVPVTIILSIITFQMWLMAYFVNSLLPDAMKGMMPFIIFIMLLFMILGIVSIFLTGLTSRPFRKVFKIKTTHGHAYLVGKICKIKTSEVTPTFGQAELQVKDSHLLLSVRATGANNLKKGGEAVILGYNKAKDTYNVKEI